MNVSCLVAPGEVEQAGLAGDGYAYPCECARGVS